MSKLKNYRPTAPVVINLIALFIALGGQAIALTGENRVKKGDIAIGAVMARNLAPGVVTKTKLAAHAVTSDALDHESVTGRAIKPGSVHGQTLLGTLEIPVDVPDADPAGPMGADGNWTTSGATATCPADAIRLNGGVKIRDSASHRAFLQSTYPNAANAATWVGEITTDTGGASPAQLFALCLH